MGVAAHSAANERASVERAMGSPGGADIPSYARERDSANSRRAGAVPRSPHVATTKQKGQSTRCTLTLSCFQPGILRLAVDAPRELRVHLLAVGHREVDVDAVV